MTHIKIGLIALVATGLATTTAYSAGFERGTADTDILFEKGTVTRAGLTVVAPKQEITSIIGRPSRGYKTPTYVVPSAAFKMDLTEDLACAGTYTTPFGGHTNYRGFSTPTSNGIDPLSNTATVETKFNAGEMGVTCSYAMGLGSGRVRAIGGVFLQTLDYNQNIFFDIRKLHLEDKGFGYRLGAAYEIPEIALRAQLMYRSSVDVKAKGDVIDIASGAFLAPATGGGVFPQSVELKVQSGVAPGWLVYGSAKWTEWSSFDVLSYTAPTAGEIQFFYRNTWKLQAGVAHVFTEKLSGTVNFTWDQGAGTGHDISESTYSIGVGARYKATDNVDLTFGAGYTFIKGGSQNFNQSGLGTFSPTPGIKVADDGHALAATFNIKIKF